MSLLRNSPRRWAVAACVLAGAACGDVPSGPTIPPTELEAQADSVLPDATSIARSAATGAVAAEGNGIVLPVRTAVEVLVEERNAAWWHSLAVAVPEHEVLQGPGYLFAWEEPRVVGPYDPGPFALELKAYNPRAPHQLFGTADYRVTGSYPSWTVRFEDGGDGDFNDIIVTVTAVEDGGNGMEASMTVTCDGATRGETVTCRASFEPSTGPDAVDPAEVTVEWRYVPGPLPSRLEGAVELEVVDSVMTGAEEWTGTGVHSGTVTARATVNGSELTGEAALEVEARDWAGVLGEYPEERPEAFVDTDLRDIKHEYPATEVDGQDDWHDGGVSKYVWDLRLIGRWNSPAVPSGPNRGYRYFTDPPEWTTPEVAVSPAMQAGHEFYDAQKGGSPEGNIIPRPPRFCSKRDLDEVLEEALEHEGVTAGNAESHHDVNMKYFQEHDFGPVVESIVFVEVDPYAVAPVVHGTIRDAIFAEVEQRHEEEVDAPGNIPQATCKLRYPS